MCCEAKEKRRRKFLIEVAGRSSHGRSYLIRVTRSTAMFARVRAWAAIGSWEQARKQFDLTDLAPAAQSHTEHPWARSDFGGNGVAALLHKSEPEHWIDGLQAIVVVVSSHTGTLQLNIDEQITLKAQTQRLSAQEGAYIQASKTLMTPQWPSNNVKSVSRG